MTITGASRFLKSLVFAALAGLVTIPAWTVLRPQWGGAATVGIGAVLLVSTYLGAVSPSRVVGLRAFGLALVLGTAGCLFAPMAAVPYLCVVLLGVVRSGLVYRMRPGRAVVLETALLVAAASFAGFLMGTSLLSLGLAVWGFFLVESVYFLFQGTSPRPVSKETEDPFERARREATRLMEEWPA